MKSQLDYLDEMAARVAKGGAKAIGPLSTGERLYVILAANRGDLLEEYGYTIAHAIYRLGDDWTAELQTRWRFRPDPRTE
jgi:hypothetical protein